MNEKIFVLLKISACIGALLWSLYTFRPLAIAIAIVFCVSLFFPRSSHRAWPPVVFGALTLLIPMQPYTVTFLNVKGEARVVSCCPGGPPYSRKGWKRAVEREGLGECKFCSDISTGFNPRYFLVW